MQYQYIVKRRGFESLENHQPGDIVSMRPKFSVVTLRIV